MTFEQRRGKRDLVNAADGNVPLGQDYGRNQPQEIKGKNIPVGGSKGPWEPWRFISAWSYTLGDQISKATFTLTHFPSLLGHVCLNGILSSRAELCHDWVAMGLLYPGASREGTPQMALTLTGVQIASLCFLSLLSELF